MFVLQDFKRPPIHINAVPAKALEDVKDWLDSVDIPFSEGPVNLNWSQIMKTVTDDPYEFYKEGGWDFLRSGENASDASDEESSAESAFDPVSRCPRQVCQRKLTLHLLLPGLRSLRRVGV